MRIWIVIRKNWFTFWYCPFQSNSPRIQHKSAFISHLQNICWKYFLLYPLVQLMIFFCITYIVVNYCPYNFLLISRNKKSGTKYIEYGGCNSTVLLFWLNNFKLIVKYELDCDHGVNPSIVGLNLWWFFSDCLM